MWARGKLKGDQKVDNSNGPREFGKTYKLELTGRVQKQRREKGDEV